MSIQPIKAKKDKKRKKEKSEPVQKGEAPSKRVRFDLSQNKITEFFKHGKVATRAIN